MTKEQKKSKRGFLFKFITLLMLVGAACMVHFEYVKHNLIPPEEPQVMKVHIETKQPETLDDSIQQDIAAEMAEDAEVTQAVSNQTVAKQDKMEQYRLHLSVVGRLCAKFLKHENYEEELVFLHKNSDDYPDDIAKILNELQEYEHRYLADQADVYTKLNFEGGFATRMVNKIIDIEKKNPEYEALEEEHKKIAAQLDRLMAYFYSREFLKKYM